MLNFRKPSRVVMAAVVVLVAVLGVSFAANKINAPAEPPNIAVQSGDKNIEWAVGKNKWNGSVFDRLDNFQWLMAGKTIYDLEHVRNGEQVLLQFDGSPPDSIALTEYILRENGNEKYGLPGMEYDIRYNAFSARFDPFSPRGFNFAVEQNSATALSSNRADYQTGNTIKGYRLACAWGENECEYAFIIRGDAAFAMEVVPPTTYEPRQWVDFYRGEELPWTSTYDLTLDEFPGVMFSWTSEKVTATDSNGIKDLFLGMPVWNVYFADINGDGFPELCATVSIGSGIIDTRVAVYDYANDRGYDLSDRMSYDYSLSIEDNRLVVTQTGYSSGGFNSNVRATGSIAIIDGELAVFGIDRTLPEVEPKETTPPEYASLLSSEQ